MGEVHSAFRLKELDIGKCVVFILFIFTYFLLFSIESLCEMNLYKARRNDFLCIYLENICLIILSSGKTDSLSETKFGRYTSEL